MPSNHLILCHPLLLLPSIFPSFRVFKSQLFASGGQNIGVSASTSVNATSSATSNEYPELISFRMDWLDLLAVQGTPRSLLQHHSSKVSILRRSAVFIVQKMIKKKKKISSLLKLKADQNSERKDTRPSWTGHQGSSQVEMRVLPKWHKVPAAVSCERAKARASKLVTPRTSDGKQTLCLYRELQQRERKL